MTDRIAELRKLVAEATPGPWMLEGRWDDHMERLGGWLSFGSQQTAHGAMFELNPLTGTPDEIRGSARLIAQAPTLATDLAAALEREAKLEAALDRLGSGEGMVSWGMIADNSEGRELKARMAFARERLAALGVKP